MKNLRINLVVVVLVIAPSLVFSQPASHVSILENIVAQAMNKSETLKAIDTSLESLNSEIKGRDIELSAKLDAELSTYKDKREIFGQTAREGQSSVFGLSLVKPFSTGTELLIATDHNLLGKDDNNPERNTAQWQVQLSQSLWKNSFGHSQSLRYKAENYELLSRKASLEFEKQNFLISIENAYWDLVMAQKELAIRKENVKRSESLESWTSRRVKQFAAEKTDLLQIQALLAQRKLDLAIIENDVISKQKNLEQLIPGLEYQSANFEAAQFTTSKITKTVSAKQIRLDTFALAQKAQQNSFEALRAEDNLRPDLRVFASYTSNGIDEEFNPSWNQAIKDNNAEQRVGLTFSMLLDGDAKANQRKAAALNAESAKYKSQASLRESETAWSELNRNLEQIDSQIKIAKNLYDLQADKLKAEQQRFQQGRTTTLQMTTFEIDASESELRLYRLLSQQQKYLSHFRLFIASGSDL